MTKSTDEANQHDQDRWGHIRCLLAGSGVKNPRGSLKAVQSCHSSEPRAADSSVKVECRHQDSAPESLSPLWREAFSAQQCAMKGTNGAAGSRPALLPTPLSLVVILSRSVAPSSCMPSCTIHIMPQLLEIWENFPLFTSHSCRHCASLQQPCHSIHITIIAQATA